ncbi:Sec-independent protein translocase protein TatB [Salinarimonas sp.]|uniref:Sec-independent protein translocase protein TatB n=1 Tax=Salinarimonas sp. TaxID=2766526 RepID=UPI0032D92079
MFDLSWGEMMLVGAVALIVIGPKDLPRTLRAVGQAVGKIKRMASEFQGQFNQAMREAELDSVRKEVEGINRAAQAGLNPAKAARDEIKRSVEGKPGEKKAEGPSLAKESDAKASVVQSPDGKVSFTKASDSKTSDSKTSDAKAPDAKAPDAGESKPSQEKPAPAASAGDDPGAKAAPPPPAAAPVPVAASASAEKEEVKP